jgi:hypothetical protein
MEGRELAESLGLDIPEEELKAMEGLSKKRVLVRCRKFPVKVAKPAPKKKAPAKKVKVEEEKGDE